jgi:hypothetical protein
MKQAHKAKNLIPSEIKRSVLPNKTTKVPACQVKTWCIPVRSQHDQWRLTTLLLAKKRR